MIVCRTIFDEIIVSYLKFIGSMDFIIINHIS